MPPRTHFSQIFKILALYFHGHWHWQWEWQAPTLWCGERVVLFSYSFLFSYHVLLFFVYLDTFFSLSHSTDELCPFYQSRFDFFFIIIRYIQIHYSTKSLILTDVLIYIVTFNYKIGVCMVLRPFNPFNRCQLFCSWSTQYSIY